MTKLERLIAQAREQADFMRRTGGGGYADVLETLIKHAEDTERECRTEADRVLTEAEEREQLLQMPAGVAAFATANGLGLPEEVAALRAHAMELQQQLLEQRQARIAVEGRLARYARGMVRMGALRRPTIGGQVMTTWKCGLCDEEQLSGSTAHDYVCSACRPELIADARRADFWRCPNHEIVEGNTISQRRCVLPAGHDNRDGCCRFES